MASIERTLLFVVMSGGALACGGALVEPISELELGETQSFVATADTTLHQGIADQGAETDCLARGDETGKLGLACLLRFAIPETSVTVASAWLDLHVLNPSPFTFDVYPVLANWSEVEASWVNRASNQPWQTAGAKGSVDRGPKLGELTVPATGDVSFVFDAAGRALVESWFDDPSKHRGIVIASETHFDGIGVASREHPIAAYRPRLFIKAGARDGSGTDARRSE